MVPDVTISSIRTVAMVTALSPQQSLCFPLILFRGVYYQFFLISLQYTPDIKKIQQRAEKSHSNPHIIVFCLHLAFIILHIFCCVVKLFLLFYIFFVFYRVISIKHKLHIHCQVPHKKWRHPATSPLSLNLYYLSTLISFKDISCVYLVSYII